MPSAPGRGVQRQPKRDGLQPHRGCLQEDVHPLPGTKALKTFYVLNLQ